MSMKPQRTCLQIFPPNLSKEMLSECEEDDSNHEIEKKDTDPGYVSRHMKQDSLGVVDSQDSYSKEVDKPDMGTYNDKEGEKVLKEDDQSHSRKSVENINGPDPYVDDMEVACDLEKLWIKGIKKAERTRKKAKERGNEPQFNDHGDSKEAVSMECASSSLKKVTSQ